MEDTLKRALENKEFEVFLQPIVDVWTGGVVGAEALARWNSPSKGLLLPACFIPAMEHCGLITELDFAILDKVCALLEKWELMCLPETTIYVNQSRTHLAHQNYVERVASVLKRHGTSTERIVLELTENGPCNDKSRLHQVCREFKAIKMQLAIDDYGAGYSSLSLLKDCSVDILKLDQSFMILTEQWRDEIILRRTIEMAKELGIKTICEGVESREQDYLLKQLDCPMAQGYYYAMPMPVKKFELLLSTSEQYQAVGG